MFAGPNGSGKSTLKATLQPEWLGVYINADDIERAIKANGNAFDLTGYGPAFELKDIVAFFEASALLERAGLRDSADHIALDAAGRLSFGSIEVNSYHAAVLADFIRRKLVEAGETVTFETVMSSRDKVDFVCRARASGSAPTCTS